MTKAEQAPVAENQSDGNPEFLVEHPNAVQDSAKAEEMAYASKGQEEHFVKNRHGAIEHAEKMDIHEANKYLEAAKQNRAFADSNAEIAGIQYDQSRKLIEQAKELK